MPRQSLSKRCKFSWEGRAWATPDPDTIPRITIYVPDAHGPKHTSPPWSLSSRWAKPRSAPAPVPRILTSPETQKIHRVWGATPWLVPPCCRSRPLRPFLCDKKPHILGGKLCVSNNGQPWSRSALPSRPHKASCRDRPPAPASVRDPKHGSVGSLWARLSRCG